MSSAAEVLTHLSDDGLTLKAADGRVWAEPRDRITDDHRRMIRTHKPELLTLLIAANDDKAAFIRWRVTVHHGEGLRSFDMLTAPGRSPEDAAGAARLRFTDRLISVEAAP